MTCKRTRSDYVCESWVVTGRTVLIAVEGEPALCSLLVDLLSDAGFTTRAVPDLGIALELARSVDFRHRGRLQLVASRDDRAALAQRVSVTRCWRKRRVLLPSLCNAQECSLRPRF